MSWLDRLRRIAWGESPRPQAQARHAAPRPDLRDEPTRLRAEVVGHYARGHITEAAAAARRLVDAQRRALGPDHPEYARDLANLATLLRAVGDEPGATRLIAAVVAIRQQVLGPDHPETAEALAVQAAWHLQPHSQPQPVRTHEPAARGAAQTPPRVEAVPVNPPESETAHDPGGPGGSPTPALAVAPYHDRWAGGLAREAALLAEALAHLSERLADSAHQFATAGTPAPDELVDEIAYCRRQFDALCHRAQRRLGSRDTQRSPSSLLDLSDALGNGEPRGTRLAELPPVALSDVAHDVARNGEAARPAPLRDGDGAPDLSARLEITPHSPPVAAPPASVAAQSQVPAQVPDDTVSRALAVLDRVVELSFTGPGDAKPLEACLASACRLRDAIRAGVTAETRGEVERLAEGRHPFVALLTLTERRESLTDAAWADLHESVVSAFGRPLALAVSRCRIRLRPR